MSDDEIPTETMTNEQIDSEIAAIEAKGIKEPSKAPEPKAGLWDGQAHAEMSKVYDALTAKSEQQIAKDTPPTVPAKNLSEAFEHTFEWMSKSDTEKAVATDAHTLVEQVKENAKKFGVELSDTDALKLAFEMETKGAQAQPGIPQELAAPMKSLRQLYPDQPPHQVVSRYAEIDRLVKSDPVEGIRWIAEQSGMNPLVLAQKLAFRYGNQVQVQANAERLVGEWLEANPAAESLHSEMLEAIGSGKVPRTGNFANDLQNALRHVQRAKHQEAKRRPKTTDAKLRQSLTDTFDRVARRAK